MTSTSKRHDMTLCDLVLNQRDEKDNRHITIKEPPIPPLPPASGGAARELGEGDGDEGEADPRDLRVFLASKGVNDAARQAAKLQVAAMQVMRACGITADPRLETAIAEALGLHCSRTSLTPQKAADLAMSNVKVYQQDRQMLRYDWSWKKFFAHGHWASPGSWPYDRAALKETRRRL